MKRVCASEIPSKVLEFLNQNGLDSTSIHFVNMIYLSLSGGLDKDEKDMLNKLHVYENAEWVMQNDPSIDFHSAVKKAESWTASPALG